MRIKGLAICMLSGLLPLPAAETGEWIDLTHELSGDAVFWPIAAERLVGLIEGRGKVAIMQGFPSAPNHRERYEAQLAVLKKHPGISIVDGGRDNDEIETAERQAAAVLGANPDLRGYLCCDAAGPVGIAAAVRKAGKGGQVVVVGMDGIRPILEAVKEGILESSAATIPAMQGSMSVLMLWQASLGIQIPQRIDTGIDLITQKNVDSFLAAAAHADRWMNTILQCHQRTAS